jgi:hypothetical protein
VESCGYELTLRALGFVVGGEGAPATRRTTANPAFVLCNGQTTAGGAQRKRWGKAIACKCGIDIDASQMGPGEEIPVALRFIKKTGPRGRPGAPGAGGETLWVGGPGGAPDREPRRRQAADHQCWCSALIWCFRYILLTPFPAVVHTRMCHTTPRQKLFLGLLAFAGSKVFSFLRVDLLWL